MANNFLTSKYFHRSSCGIFSSASSHHHSRHSTLSTLTRWKQIRGWRHRITSWPKESPRRKRVQSHQEDRQRKLLESEGNLSLTQFPSSFHIFPLKFAWTFRTWRFSSPSPSPINRWWPLKSSRSITSPRSSCANSSTTKLKWWSFWSMRTSSSIIKALNLRIGLCKSR